MKTKEQEKAILDRANGIYFEKNNVQKIKQTQLMRTAKCRICGDNAVLSTRTNSMVHASTGMVYAGTCFCEGGKHTKPHDDKGNLICRTWRDDHYIQVEWTANQKPF